MKSNLREEGNVGETSPAGINRKKFSWSPLWHTTTVTGRWRLLDGDNKSLRLASEIYSATSCIVVSSDGTVRKNYRKINLRWFTCLFNCRHTATPLFHQNNSLELLLQKSLKFNMKWKVQVELWPCLKKWLISRLEVEHLHSFYK